MDTSALVADTDDQPFALEFDLEPGDLIPQDGLNAAVTAQTGPPPFGGNASNIVTLSNFNFGGGSAADPGTDPAFYTQGGVTGDISNTVTISGTDPDNYLSQSFTPGSTLSFTIAYTNNQSDSGIPDTFDFAILDSNGYEIPTQGSDIFPSFLVITFDGDVPEVDTYDSDPTSPTSAGQYLDIAAPIVTETSATPEPGTFWFLGSALILLVFRKKMMMGMRRVVAGKAALTAIAAVLRAAALGSGGLMAADSPEFFTGTYRGHPVTYQIVNGYAVIQGDMVIGTASVRTERDCRRISSFQEFHPESNTVNLSTDLWPKVSGVVTVPYTVVVGTPNMTTAINNFNTPFAGKFQWVPRTNQKSYVEIDLENQSLNSCYASLENINGKGMIQGANGCNVSALLHEMGHNMGFAHEQSRANRNSYLNIDFTNIAPVSQSQYTQEPNTTMDLSYYDYASLMEYGPRGFTRNGNPEMESIPVGIPFGDPPTYSTGDIDALNRIYFTPPGMVTITTNPSGLQIIVDGALTRRRSRSAGL